MKKKMTKEQRIDMKEEVLKLIKANSEDGLLESEVISMFDHNDFGRGLARAFLEEFIREGRVEIISRGRIKIYKAVGK